MFWKKTWVYNDGGRFEAGYKGHTGDCVTRAIAIGMKMEYREVYHLVRHRLKYRPKKMRRGRETNSPRDGVHPILVERIITELGWEWVPLAQKGYAVDLKPNQLPKGRIIVAMPGHLTTVIDGVVHDTWDASQDFLVEGYFAKAA
jgi:hypothetical protein